MQKKININYEIQSSYVKAASYISLENLQQKQASLANGNESLKNSCKLMKSILDLYFVQIKYYFAFESY